MHQLKGRTFSNCRKSSSTIRAKELENSADAPASPGLETAGNNFKALKDIEEIQTILPHRCSL